jgi:hypothetical protein
VVFEVGPAYPASSRSPDCPCSADRGHPTTMYFSWRLGASPCRLDESKGRESIPRPSRGCLRSWVFATIQRHHVSPGYWHFSDVGAHQRNDLGSLCKQGVVGSIPIVSTTSDQGILSLSHCSEEPMYRGCIKGATTGWKATGQPTVRQQRDKWVVRVDGIDTETGRTRPRQLGTYASKRAAMTASRSLEAEGGRFGS